MLSVKLIGDIPSLISKTTFVFIVIKEGVSPFLCVPIPLSERGQRRDYTGFIDTEVNNARNLSAYG